jgi:hypothetical protein
LDARNDSAMPDYDPVELARYRWMQSRIPALDALVAFVPSGARDPAVDSFATGVIATPRPRKRPHAVPSGALSGAYS